MATDAAQPSRSVYAGIFAVSAATLLFQVTFVRIFSVSIWYHFAFLVVSVALFGIGASGVALSFVPPGPREARLRALAPLCFSISGLLAYFLTNAIPFSPFRILQEPKQLLFFFVYDVLLMIPFFFSGATVALILRTFPVRAGRLYAFDLVGAAVGTLLVFFVLPLGGARGAIALSSALGVVSAACLAPAPRMRTVFLVVVLAHIPWLVKPSLLPDVRMDSTKIVAIEKGRGGQQVVSRWNALSRIDVIEATGKNPTIFIDAAAATPVIPPQDSTQAARDISTVAYRLRPGGDVAVIGSGGGVDVQNALALGASSITAIEINPIIIDLVTNRYRDFVGDVFHDPRVRLVRDEGRSCIARSKQRFDVIQITLIDTWAASVSGAYSLSENYLYTTEAFAEYIAHLDDDGFLSITRWYYEMPRLTMLARAALEELGVDAPSRHIMVVEDRIRDLLLVKRTPFTPDDIARARAYAGASKGAVLHDPLQRIEDQPYDYLLTASDLGPVFKDAEIQLEPVRDDSPFFFQMTRWKSVKLEALRKFGGQGFLEPLAIPVAQIALLSALIISLVLSTVLIVVPLVVKKGRAIPRERRGTWLVYFVCLGLAFIIVEVVLMQRFALFLGHPTYSVTAVLFAILLFSGLGAAWSDRRGGTTAEVARPVLWGLPIAILLLTFVVPLLLRELIGLPHAARLLIAIALIAPVAFLMGVPFPLGIRAIAATGGQHIPWAWAANGCASVVGSVCAVLGAMVWNFSTMLVIAGGIYVLALTMISKMRQPLSS
jgi:predicted membrane-bound spermidine synthase